MISKCKSQSDNYLDRLLSFARGVDRGDIPCLQYEGIMKRLLLTFFLFLPVSGAWAGHIIIESLPDTVYHYGMIAKIEFNILTTESIANKIYNGINLSGVNIQ